jgi:hypothetical protein
MNGAITIAAASTLALSTLGLAAGFNIDPLARV